MPALNLIVNGSPRKFPAGTTLEQLLAELGLAGRPVAVEVNLSVVPRAEHEACVLEEGDALEVVTLVGGG